MIKLPCGCEKGWIRGVLCSFMLGFVGSGMWRYKFTPLTKKVFDMCHGPVSVQKGVKPCA